MQIKEIITVLEITAPPSMQEDYDNAGLLTGEPGWICTGIITCLDATEAVINEAIEKNCNLVVAHHPIIFKGLKKITGKSYIERTVILAIKNDIAIYAIHTNLDNVKAGVNKKIAEKLNLQDLEVLKPKESLLKKLITFAPSGEADKIRTALFAAGAGNLGKYSECSFNSTGTSTFKPGEGANPFVGKVGVVHEEAEVKIEVIFPGHLQQNVISAMVKAHPYEEVAYDVISLGNFLSDAGSGLVGSLPIEMTEGQFLRDISQAFHLECIRHTAFTGKEVRTVAICGGAGVFLLPDAIAKKADVFITADIKYHEFFDADGKILLADIGHYEGEQFTIDLLFDLLRQNFPNFAVLKTGVNTNPVCYFKGSAQ